MPHIHLEYSDNVENLDTQALLLLLNQGLVVANYVSFAHEIKSRAICQHEYLIGLGEPNQAYVHAKVSLLTGRTEVVQQEISKLMLSLLLEHLPKQSDVSLQVCVEILEMQRSTYSKQII